MVFSMAARSKPLFRGKALVFGERATAEILAQQFSREGFEPVFQVDLDRDLPLPGTPAGLKRVKALLERFRLDSLGQGVVHPGATHWAERPELASLCSQMAMPFFGPSVKTLSFFYDKLNFILQSERLEIPHLVLSPEPMHSLTELQVWMKQSNHSYPLTLRSIHGGGRQGLFFARDEDTVLKNFPLWVKCLREAVGETLFMVERFLDEVRLISVPFVRFGRNQVQIFPKVDASLRCAYRKWIEFCPAEYVDPSLSRRMDDWTFRCSEKSDYIGVGVLEFVVNGPHAFLVDALPRLNTGFHLWEKMAGMDIVSCQIAVLEKKREYSPLKTVTPADETLKGVSIRLYAEDPLMKLPQVGEIAEISSTRQWEMAGAQGQLWMSYQKGERVQIFDSGMLGQLFVWGQTDSQRMTFARGILNEFWIAGSLQTNEHYLGELLSHPWVREGVFHADFLDYDFLPSKGPSMEWIQWGAVLCLMGQDLGANPDPLLPPLRWSAGIWSGRVDRQAKNYLCWAEGPFFWSETPSEEKGLRQTQIKQIKRKGASGVIELQNGEQLRVCAFPLEDRWNIRMGHWFLTIREPGPPLSDLGQQRQEALKFPSLIYGRVHSVLFREGAQVPPHEPLILIEALGFQIPQSLPIPVRIRHWEVKAGEQVLVGQTLARCDRI